MNKIAFPLKPDMQGTLVADLQDALQQCLDRGILPLGDDDERTRRKWAAALERERDGQTYGDATAKLVSLFQDGRHLQASGEVDRALQYYPCDCTLSADRCRSLIRNTFA